MSFANCRPFCSGLTFIPVIYDIFPNITRLVRSLYRQGGDHRSSGALLAAGKNQGY